MKITVVCGHGLGSSLIIEMGIKSILQEIGVAADVDHIDLASVSGGSSDILVAARDISEMLPANGVAGKIVTLDSVVDKKSMREKLVQALTELEAI